MDPNKPQNPDNTPPNTPPQPPQTSETPTEGAPTAETPVDASPAEEPQEPQKPEQTPQQTPTESPVMGAPTAPMGSGPAPTDGGQPAPAPGKSNNKLFIIIGAVVGGLVLLGGALWLVLSSGIFGGSITLEEYDNENYTIMVPADYEENGTDRQRQFEPAGGESGVSTVLITRQDLQGIELDEEDQDELFETMGELLEEDARYESVELSATEHDGNRAMSVSLTVEEKSGRGGTGEGIFIINNEALYSVLVAAHDGNDALRNEADTIIDSFTIK